MAEYQYDIDVPEFAGGKDLQFIMLASIPPHIRAKYQNYKQDRSLCVCADVFEKRFIQWTNKPTAPIISAIMPEAVFSTLKSSTIAQRMTMFIIGHQIAQQTGALFYCMQLSRTADMQVKKCVLDTTIPYQDKMPDIFNYLCNIDSHTRANASCPEECECIAEMMRIPLEPTIDTARAIVGETITKYGPFVRMHRMRRAHSKHILQFPNEAHREMREDDVDLPVVYLEPLKMASAWEHMQWNNRYESQLYIIVGRIIIGMFPSATMSISCANNLMLEKAAAWGVSDIQKIMFIDCDTWITTVTNWRAIGARLDDTN